MAPGPLTAAAIGMGTGSKYAGLTLAIGHGFIEFPLMILIMLGADKILKSTKTRIIIGLVGGAFLLLMAIQMLTTPHVANEPQVKAINGTPLLAGLILSAGNPYFLLWWATVGLRLATSASQLGILAYVLFAILHWLCDLIWLGALSWASFKGAGLIGQRSQQIVLLICSMALLGFGLFFIYNAIRSLSRLLLARN